MLGEAAYDNDTEDDDEEENWEDTTWGCADDTQSTKPTSCFKGEGGEPLVKPPSTCNNVKLPVANGTSNGAEERGLMSRMLLNDNKAGMEGLDKNRINQVILESSKGSKYFENEKKKEEQVNKKIEEQIAKLKKIGDVQLRQGLMEADKLLEELECQRDLGRIIVHIDMDAFYAAVEMRDDPTLRDKPMAVGGYSMLSTSNYLARKFGVRAAMPGFIGKKLCPDLVMVKPNFEKYTAVSREIRSVMADYDPNYCPMSLDEAYLDITDHLEKRMQSSRADRTFLCHRPDSNNGNCECDLNTAARDAVLSARLSHQQRNSKSTTNYFQRTNSAELDGIQQNELITRPYDGNNSEENLIPSNEVTMASKGACPLCGKPFPPYDVVTFGLSAEDTVEEMRSRINQKTKLTASAGIAPNMMLAKVCSDKNKPNGQYRIPATRDAVMEFVTDLPIRKISGIGKVSEKMLNTLNIYTCYHLYNQRALLYHLYSPISFNYFMRICMGIGSVTVERDSDRKSMSTERTFREISKPEELVRKCQELCVSLCEDLKEEKLKGKTVAIKLKTVKYEVKTRAQTLSDYTADLDMVFSAARALLHTEIQNMAPHPLRLRLMGVRISSLLNEDLCQKKQQQNTLARFVKQLGRVNSDDPLATEKLTSVSPHNPVSTGKLGPVVSEKPRSTGKQERAGSDWAISRENTGNTASQNDASTTLSCFDTPKKSVTSLTDDSVTTTSEKNQCDTIKGFTDKTDVGECETSEKESNKTIDSIGSFVAFKPASAPEVLTIKDKMSEKIPQLESVESQAITVLNSKDLEQSKILHDDCGIHKISLCTKSSTSEGVEEIPKTCVKVNISDTCGEFMKSANDALLWDPGNQVPESLKIEGSHQDSLEGDNSRRQADSPGPSRRQAGSPAPSCRQADSPGPSCRQADSPGPSLRQAGSPGPSCRQADSPGPFVCPVCQDEVVCEDLSEFNQHIDICLNKKIVMECSKYRPEEDQKKKLSKTPNSVRKRTPVRKMSGSPSNHKQKTKMSTPQGVASLSSPKVGVSCKSDCKTDTSIYKSLTADCDVSMATPSSDAVSMATSNSDPVSKTDPSSDHVSDSGVTMGSPLTTDWSTDTKNLVCPVCFMEQTGTSLDEFNTHVDTCLSKGTITQMIQEQKVNTKRLSSGPSPQSVKRKRVDSGAAAPKTKCIDTFFQKVRLETGN